MQPQPSLVGQSHGRQPAYTPSTEQGESTITLNQFTGKMRALRREGDNIVPVSSAAEQNADEAADYWSTL